MAVIGPKSMDGAAAKPSVEGSSLSPFRHRAFTVLWIATVVSNVGTWMQNAAAGWLMTSLDGDAFVVSLVQVATALPMFLFALPAGALADIVDRRRLLTIRERIGQIPAEKCRVNQPILAQRRVDRG